MFTRTLCPFHSGADKKICSNARQCVHVNCVLWGGGRESGGKPPGGLESNLGKSPTRPQAPKLVCSKYDPRICMKIKKQRTRAIWQSIPAAANCRRSAAAAAAVVSRRSLPCEPQLRKRRQCPLPQRLRTQAGIGIASSPKLGEEGGAGSVLGSVSPVQAWP